jgi:ATP-dependent RNA helicase DeaD
MLVPPSRRRKAEIMLRQGSIDAIWGTTPQAEEIRKLDQQRMMQDALFTEEPSEDDLVLARALLAERSGEAIAAALARLYRARLPAPEDILDPGQDRYRDRFAERGNPRDARGPRDSGGDDFEQAPRKPRSPRREMANGSMWFRVSAGRLKKAEARWLLPMICRRGGIDKNDIGAIRIYEHHSEFEISAEAAEKFQTKIKRPDKEQHVILALPGGPQGEKQAEAAPAKPAAHAADNAKPYERKPFVAKRHEGKPYNAEPREATQPEAKPFERKPYEGKRTDGKPRYDKKRPFGKKHKHDDRPAHGGGPRGDAAPFAKAPFAKPAFAKSNFTKPAFGETGKPAKAANGPKKPKKNKKQKHRQNPMIAD